MAIPPICYCNHKLRGSKEYPYRCINVKELPNSPWLTDACASSGWDISCGQKVGLVSKTAEKESADRWHKIFSD